MPAPGTVTEWREYTPENIALVEDVEPDKELEYRMDVCHGTRSSHVEHLYLVICNFQH